MNFDPNYELQRQRANVTRGPERWLRQGIGFAAVVLLSASAFARYGGTGMPTGSGSGTPSYGHGAAIGAGVGAAAAGAGAIYFLTHRTSKVSGCVETSDDGLHLTDDKTKRSLMLVPGKADVKAGDRVELKGKFKKSATGDQSFLVKTVAKDFGECRAQAAASSASAWLPKQGKHSKL
jgi:hypothetical protein